MMLTSCIKDEEFILSPSHDRGIFQFYDVGVPPIQSCIFLQAERKRKERERQEMLEKEEAARIEVKMIEIQIFCSTSCMKPKFLHTGHLLDSTSSLIS